MFKIVHFLLALVIILALAWLVSFDRRKIRIRFVLQLIVIEIALAFFFSSTQKAACLLLNTFPVSLSRCLNSLPKGRILSLAGWVKKGLAFIFLGVLCPIIFISALIGILQHWRILPIFIRVIGTLLSKLNGMGKLESFNAVSSLILGQSENFIAYKGVLGDLSSRRLFTMAATAMSTVSLSIVGALFKPCAWLCGVGAVLMLVPYTFLFLPPSGRPAGAGRIRREKRPNRRLF